MQTDAAGATSHEGNFTIETEKGVEVFDFGHFEDCFVLCYVLAAWRNISAGSEMMVGTAQSDQLAIYKRVYGIF